MPPSNGWLEQFQEVCDRFGRSVVSSQRFEASIASLVEHPHSSLEAVVYRMIRTSPFYELSFGKPLPTEAARVERIDRFDENGTQCKIELWPKVLAPEGREPLDWTLAF